MATITQAADKFIDMILGRDEAGNGTDGGWTFDQFEDTATAGYLSEYDDEILSEFCDEAGEDRAEAEAEVMEFIREHVAERHAAAKRRAEEEAA